jgi:serine/threonine-protein kinase RsbW
MRMKVSFSLPRRPDSVAVARQLVDRILAAFGVRADCRRELVLAVSEACTNAVGHAAGVPVYELAAESDGSDCLISVNDDGPGVDHRIPTDMPAAEAVTGRGMSIISLMTDRLEIHRRSSGGLSVRMFKRLRWVDRPRTRLAIKAPA